MKSENISSVEYVTVSKLVSGLAIALILIAGWLFHLIVTATNHLRDTQASQSISTATNEFRLQSVESRLLRDNKRINMLEHTAAVGITNLKDIQEEIAVLKSRP